ncbi:MAG: HAD family hydrolase [Bacteroidota bacterium]
MSGSSIDRVAVFLDRDGTIIENVPYLANPNELKFLPNSVEAIRLLNEIGVKVFVITNQSGIARGFLSEEILNDIHFRMHEILKSNNAKIDKFFYCPHLIDSTIEKYSVDCDCRKPKSGLILQAFNKYNIDLNSSFVIGDSAADMLAGKNVGAFTILVQTGYGKRDKDSSVSSTDFVANDLLDAVKFISSKIKKLYAV